MAITKVINDAVDLNQTSDYSGLRLPVGTTGNVVESFTTDYLVVGGGGSGSLQGAGGAGGLRTSYNNSTTTTNTLSFPSGKTAIATYMLDGNATDVSQNYDGGEYNITYNTGKYGGAAVFNGSSSYVSINSSTALQLLGDYTVSFWFKTNALSGTQRLVNKDNANDYSGGWSFLLYSNGTFNWSHNDGSNNQNWNINAGTISTNTWYNVCAVYSDSNNLRTFYLNGSSVATIATNTNVAASTDNLFFGTFGKRW